MAYDSNAPAASPVSEVRFWLQDTAASSLLSDGEIQYLITYLADYSADPILIAATACGVVASRYARVASISIDGGSISGSGVAQQMRDHARYLRDEYFRIHGSEAAPYAGGIEFGDYPGIGTKGPLFAIGQFDIDPAGVLESAQDYNDGVLDNAGLFYPNS